jgi:hypothetical protein
VSADALHGAGGEFDLDGAVRITPAASQDDFLIAS